MTTYAIDFDNTITSNTISGVIFNKGVRPLNWLISKEVNKEMEMLSVEEKRKLIAENLNEKNISADISCLVELREFIVEAIKNGHKIAIATFSDAGSADRVQKIKYKKGGWIAGELLVEAYLKVIFKDSPEIISQIIIKAEMPKKTEPQNKNKQLIQLFEETQQKVMLFDDSAVSVDAANNLEDERFEAVLVNNTNPEETPLAKTLAQHLSAVQLKKNDTGIDVTNLGKSLTQVTNLRCSDELRKSGEAPLTQDQQPKTLACS